MEKEMTYLPVSINITDKKILLIGGGKVALEKVTSLRRFTSNIHIVSEQADEVIKNSGFKITYKSYNKTDLNDYYIVYACTNNREKNLEIKHDCENLSKLVNIVDNPKLCDFISPAIYKQNNMTVAVSSNGKEVRKSIKWRNEIREVIENGTLKL